MDIEEIRDFFSSIYEKATNQIKIDLNALRIMKEDSDLMYYIKDYYENMWSDIYDEDDMKFMKYWSNEAYKNSGRTKNETNKR